MPGLSRIAWRESRGRIEPWIVSLLKLWVLIRLSRPLMGESTVATLGSTNDPRVLIPGQPAEIFKNIAVLRDRATGTEHAAEGLRGVDTGAWTGPASEAFHDKFSYEPARWYDASDALSVAVNALEGYASTLTWAQGQAAHAIGLWDQAQAATKSADAEHQQAMTQASVDNQPAPIF